MNFDNVVRAMSVMRDDLGYGLANKRVTLSTSGLVPQIDRLSSESDVSLAVSLHAPNDELRETRIALEQASDQLVEAVHKVEEAEARHRTEVAALKDAVQQLQRDRDALAEAPALRRGLIGFAVAVLALFLFLPLATVFIEAFGKGVGGFIAALSDPEVQSSIKLTLIVAAICVPINTAFGVVIGVGLWWIGVPSPILFGVVAGILRFVPYIGAVLGATVNTLFIDHFQQMAHGHFTVRRLERKYGSVAVKAAYQAIDASPTR
jgi:hypothetical protein